MIIIPPNAHRGALDYKFDYLTQSESIFKSTPLPSLKPGLVNSPVKICYLIAIIQVFFYHLGFRTKLIDHKQTIDSLDIIGDPINDNSIRYQLGGLFEAMETARNKGQISNIRTAVQPNPTFTNAFDRMIMNDSDFPALKINNTSYKDAAEVLEMLCAKIPIVRQHFVFHQSFGGQRDIPFAEVAIENILGIGIDDPSNKTSVDEVIRMSEMTLASSETRGSSDVVDKLLTVRIQRNFNSDAQNGEHQKMVMQECAKLASNDELILPIDIKLGTKNKDFRLHAIILHTGNHFKTLIRVNHLQEHSAQTPAVFHRLDDTLSSYFDLGSRDNIKEINLQAYLLFYIEKKHVEAWISQ